MHHPRKDWTALVALLLALGSFMLFVPGCQSPAESQSRQTDAAVPSAPAAPALTLKPMPTAEPTSEPSDTDLVRIQDYIPTLYVDLRYATTNNCTGTQIYDFTDARLRYGTVKKLARVQQTLLQQGFSLKIWDAFRPISAQFRLWEVCPNNAYVANPNTGYSSHSRGNTIDITLVLSDGSEIPMPSGFDEFTALADRDYSDVSAEAAVNAELLEAAMLAEGFAAYSGEWWHYSDAVVYEVIKDA